jgi:hypothetical protein
MGKLSEHITVCVKIELGLIVSLGPYSSNKHLKMTFEIGLRHIVIQFLCISVMMIQSNKTGKYNPYRNTQSFRMRPLQIFTSKCAYPSETDLSKTSTVVSPQRYQI